MAKQKQDKELTFEESLAKLESIVASIEQGKIGIEQAISEYGKGVQLIQHCRSVLAEAENKIQQLQVAGDGTLKATPLENPPGEAE